MVEAMKTLLAARRDLRIALGCRMYERGEASLGGACQIADVGIETMKSALSERGIERVSDADVGEVEKMAQRAIKFSRRK